MANHKSAIKRARQNDKRRARNTALRGKTKTEAKKSFTGVTGAANRADALKALSAADRVLQKAVSKGVLPKERASRKLARMAAALNAKFKPEAARASK
ncbi:MAG: 30S ribosomal protein S20 [Deltaproteobacteria bacterium]|nr:30S ribosomal protein S20 [Deltaproteobacteria bacterium]